MSDTAPPPSTPRPPAPTPPSIETAVQDHLNVIHEVRELRREVKQLRVDVDRALDVASVVRLMLGRLGRHLGVALDA